MLFILHGSILIIFHTGGNRSVWILNSKYFLGNRLPETFLGIKVFGRHLLAVETSVVQGRDWFLQRLSTACQNNVTNRGVVFLKSQKLEIQ